MYCCPTYHFSLFQCTDFKNYSPVVEFDGANGVGAFRMKDAISHFDETLVVNIHNDDTSNADKLNFKVRLYFFLFSTDPK